jgi:4-hydroxy-2-oxoheptanedioate aldolase
MKMKNRLKELLKAGTPAIGTLVALPSPPAVEVLANVGFDWLVIDCEHGPIDVETLHAMIRATSGTTTVPTVRVARNLDWLAKQVLDIGAMGVMMPSVNSREEALMAVRAARYPPEGNRGFGPTFAALRWGLEAAEYANIANSEIMAILQIEHLEAVNRIDEILAVPGVDLALLGPYDLSGSLGFLGQVAHPAVQGAIAHVLAAAKKAKVPVGIFGTTPEEINRYLGQGFQAVLIGVDASFLAAGARAVLDGIKR